MQQPAQDLTATKTLSDLYYPDIENQVVYSSHLGTLFEGDCLEFLPSIRSQSIDTVFADPPFNLSKQYGPKVNDKLPDSEYLAWSRQWLDECVRVLKPGGSLFVYNLLKWNMMLGGYIAE